MYKYTNAFDLIEYSEHVTYLGLRTCCQGNSSSSISNVFRLPADKLHS